MTCIKNSQVGIGGSSGKVASLPSFDVCKNVSKDSMGVLDKKRTAAVIHARYFWIFMTCCVVGLAIEEIYHLAVFHEIENRTGLLFGPFSPIYGIGGVCIVAVSQLVSKRSPLVGFVCFAAVGGSVEFLVSFVLESCFGIVAWDYSGTWLSLDGRTNGYFMIMWGLLGLACAYYFVPLLDKTLMPVLERIPLVVTKAIAVGMTVNIILTLVSFNCWYHRLDGAIPSTPVQHVCAVLFNDEFMATHFETMSLHPDRTLRG